MRYRPAFERILILVALGIAAIMLLPFTSPLLSSDLPFSREREIAPPTVDVAPLHFTAATLPLAAEEVERPPAPDARGLLMTGYTAGGARFETLLDMIRRTELNAVVIDIKDESGEVSWLPEREWGNLAGAGRRKIRDPAALIESLRREDIYVIGRIVTFQDPILAEARPDLAVQDTKGGIWRTTKGIGWGDPFSEEVQRYNIELAIEALELGFQEIQYDYVRFPSDGDLNRAWFRHRDLRPETRVIQQFLARARSEIVPRGGYISADLFGLVTLATDDMGIGQRLDMIAQEVDYVSLMLYPSHYAKPEYGISDPEADPYQTISLSVKDAKRRIAGTRAKLRPWIQDFSLKVRYTPKEVRAQIQALEDEGITEWLLWNAGNRYTEDALRPAGARRR